MSGQHVHDGCERCEQRNTVNSDLLAACEEMLTAIEEWNNGSGHESACMTQSSREGTPCDCGADKARAAIAKARGQ